MIQFVFSFLHIVLFIVFIIYGIELSRGKNTVGLSFWKKAIVPVFVYGIVKGCRFGRPVDWNLYYFRYKDIGEHFIQDEYELIYKILNFSFYTAGLPYWFFIFCECMFLITSILLFFRYYKNELLFTLPICLTFIYNNEMYIRWYTGLCFFLLACGNMLVENRRKMYFFLILAVLTHYGTILLMPILLLAKILNKYKLNPYISCVLVLVTSFSMHISQLSVLTDISNYLLAVGFITGSAEHYLSNTERLINGDYGNIGLRDPMSFISQIRFLFAYVPVILYSYESCAKRKFGTLWYNLFVVGVIVFPLFESIEITDRYSQILVFFCSLSGGFLYYDTFIRKNIKVNILSRIIITISLIFNIWPSISICIIPRPIDELLYIWDANGRNYLPF